MTEATTVSENRLSDNPGVEVSEIRDPLWVVPVVWTATVTYTGLVAVRAATAEKASEAFLDIPRPDIEDIDEVDQDHTGPIEIDTTQKVRPFS